LFSPPFGKQRGDAASMPVRSFDHFVGLNEQRGRYLDPEFLGGLQVDANFVLGWLGDWDVGRICPIEDFSDYPSAIPEKVRPNKSKTHQPAPFDKDVPASRLSGKDTQLNL
jgi:hypothetical protein